jgi:hypothetical protein
MLGFGGEACSKHAPGTRGLRWKDITIYLDEI